MTLAYYAVPPRSQNRPLGRLKENKLGKKREKVGRRQDSGSEQGGGSWDAASRAAREATCLPGKHSAAFPGRALSKTQSPPWNRPAPCPGPRCRNSRGGEDESRSQPFFIRCNRPRKNSGPGSQISRGTRHRTETLPETSAPSVPHPARPAQPRPAQPSAPRPAPDCQTLRVLRCSLGFCPANQHDVNESRFRKGKASGERGLPHWLPWRELNAPKRWRHWAGLICITAAPWSPCPGLESRSSPN